MTGNRKIRDCNKSIEKRGYSDRKIPNQLSKTQYFDLNQLSGLSSNLTWNFAFWKVFLKSKPRVNSDPDTVS
jgi:hypothetical protein